MVNGRKPCFLTCCGKDTHIVDEADFTEGGGGNQAAVWPEAVERFERVAIDLGLIVDLEIGRFQQRHPDIQRGFHAPSGQYAVPGGFQSF